MPKRTTKTSSSDSSSVAPTTAKSSTEPSLLSDDEFAQLFLEKLSNAIVIGCGAGSFPKRGVVDRDAFVDTLRATINALPSLVLQRGMLERFDDHAESLWHSYTQRIPICTGKRQRGDVVVEKAGKKQKVAATLLTPRDCASAIHEINTLKSAGSFAAAKAIYHSLVLSPSAPPSIIADMYALEREATSATWDHTSKQIKALARYLVAKLVQLDRAELVEHLDIVAHIFHDHALYLMRQLQTRAAKIDAKSKQEITGTLLDFLSPLLAYYTSNRRPVALDSAIAAALVPFVAFVSSFEKPQRPESDHCYSCVASSIGNNAGALLHLLSELRFLFEEDWQLHEPELVPQLVLHLLLPKVSVLLSTSSDFLRLILVAKLLVPQQSKTTKQIATLVSRLKAPEGIARWVPYLSLAHGDFTKQLLSSSVSIAMLTDSIEAVEAASRPLSAADKTASAVDPDQPLFVLDTGGKPAADSDTSPSSTAEQGLMSDILDSLDHELQAAKRAAAAAAESSDDGGSDSDLD